MSIQNIIMPPDTEDHWRHQHDRNELLAALQDMQTIRHELGDKTFHLLASNAIWYERIAQCVERIRDAKPQHSDYGHDKRPRVDPAKQYFRPKHTGRVNPEEPVAERLKEYRDTKCRKVRDYVEEHLKAADYGEQHAEFSDIIPASLTVTRKTRRWRSNQWTVSYTAVVPSDWLKSGASEVADQFGHTFFPLRCEGVPSGGEHRLYKVKRAMYRPKPKSDEVSVKVEEGYAAFLIRPGKDSLTGWGKTPDAASKAIDRARALEARKRLLAV